MRKSEEKAEYLFAENSVTAQFLAVLGTGERSAISSKQIQKAFGLSQRELRRIVESCRKKGVYILASDSGYFFPENDDELRRFIRRENNRIKNQCIAIAPLKRLLKEIDNKNHTAKKRSF